MDTLGDRLAQARRNCGMTQSQDAQKLYITTQAVSSWECGNTMPDTEKIPEIAALYGVSSDWLLSGRTPSAGILEATSDLSDRVFSEERMGTYISAYCDARQFYQTKKALAFAREKHAGQYRKGKDRVPYIYHPLTVTCHAMALGLKDDDLLAACLLHDVCEDCGVAPEELPVDDAVREAVRLLTKPADFSKTEEQEKAYYDAIAGNRIAVMVKLLDRCHNVSSMAAGFSDERMAEYITETKTYVDPLLERARKNYPEYSDQLFLIRYHMTSVLEALRHHMRSAL